MRKMTAAAEFEGGDLMAKVSRSSKKTSPAEVRERAKTIRHGQSLVSKFFNEDVVLAIQTKRGAN
jgi:hypothetical protein